MRPTTVRCPNCRKKQEEPYPNRCGCGQSLLSVLAVRRGAAGRLPGPLTTDGAGQAAAGGLPASGENDW